MEKEIYWSRFAADFEARNNYVVGETDMALVKQQIRGLKQLGRTLELGCGNGTYSELMAGEATQLWSTDYSDEMLETAAARLATLENLVVEKQNCHALTYDDARFDTVVMINLLHIIPDPGLALKEAQRVLAPGGQLLILSFTTDGMRFLAKLGMLYRYLRTYGKPSATTRHLTIASTRTLMADAGFQVHDTDLIGKSAKAVWARGVAA
ncbi:MAG: class I SAM-dependent methyltransferase [Desulfobacter sp.]